MLSYAVEVITRNIISRKVNTAWTGNELRFATRREAEDYARDLAGRWTAVQDWRVVESPDAPNQSFTITRIADYNRAPGHDHTDPSA